MNIRIVGKEGVGLKGLPEVEWYIGGVGLIGIPEVEWYIEGVE